MHNERNPQVMKGNKLQISVTIDPDQVLAIDNLATLRRTSRAALFREALDLFLIQNITPADIRAADIRVSELVPA